MRTVLAIGLLLCLCSALASADPGTDGHSAVGVGGVSGIWVLANVSYAGMRAQANPHWGWRIIAFIFGFPGTLVSLVAVRKGAERAYGIDLPKRSP